MPNPDYTAWRFWFDALQVIGLCLLGVYSWWVNREKVTTGKFREHERRICQLENNVRHPDCQHHGGFEARIATLHGDIRELSGGVKGLRRAVDLMNEYLINNGGKR